MFPWSLSGGAATVTAGRRCFGHREVEGSLALVLVGGVLRAAQFSIVSTALGRGEKVEFAFDRGRRGRVFVLALAMEVAEIESKAITVGHYAGDVATDAGSSWRWRSSGSWELGE